MKEKLRLERIDKSFQGKKVLSGIDLTVHEGEFLSILGSSGGGKSTILNIMAGFIRDHEGNVILDGRDITQLPTAERNIVMLHQNLMLFPHMSMRQNIEYGLRVRKYGREERERRSAELIERIELKGREDDSVRNFSGGERQRIALARALAVRPELLLLDEPFSSLDTDLRVRMREFTKDMVKKEGIATVLVTHDREEAFLLSDRVALLSGGRIVRTDTPWNLMNNPGDERTAILLGYENIITRDGRRMVYPVDSIKVTPSNDGTHTVERSEFNGRVLVTRLRSLKDPSEIITAHLKEESVEEGRRAHISIFQNDIIHLDRV